MAMDGQDAGRAEFRRVMAYATERATNDGLEEEVMAALFDVFDAWAQRADAVTQGATG
jgi:hypothetical protein